MEENNQIVNYGICCGTVKNGGKIFTKPHFYTDGNQHGYNSDGLCPKCFEINEKFRVQRKINKLEEKLNEQKRYEILKNFDISNTIIES